MKLTKLSVLAVLPAAIMLFGLSTIVRADTTTPPANPPAQASAPTKPAGPVVPDVPLPFAFKCPHCGMTIKIKTSADWTKSCFGCACGLKNIVCYNDSLKKPAK
jgi:hypothetical protein